MTVVGIAAVFDLIYEITDDESMFLVCTEDQGFLILIDLVHEQSNPILLPLRDLNGPIEFRLLVSVPLFNFTLDLTPLNGAS